MFCEVSASFELGEHAEHRQQVLGLRRVGGPVEQAALHRRLDGLIEVVDVRVGGDKVAGGLAVRANKGMGRAGDGVLYEGEELDYVPVDQLEFNRVFACRSPGRVNLEGALDRREASRHGQCGINATLRRFMHGAIVRNHSLRH